MNLRRAIGKKVGLLMNFNVERLKDGIKVHHLREHRVEKESGLFNLLILKNISVNSVVNFLTIVIILRRRSS